MHATRPITIHMSTSCGCRGGVEVDASGWISSKGKDQYDLCGNAFLEVMKGGTITFGDPVDVNILGISEGNNHFIVLRRS